MSSINNAYINALLADAAYVTILNGIPDEGELKLRLTPTQAAYLAANFTVVTSIETPNTINPLLGTGFDAVVWQIKAGSELAGPNNVNAGKIFVSMRGTQGLTDSADDITLATRGIPYDQIRDMVNWWLKNTAAVTNTQVRQIKVQETVVSLSPLVTVKTFALDTPTTGTGLLNELDGIAGVNGHSLGGYLSTAFARIFGAAWGVEQVSTFNSAGFSNAAGLNIASEYDNIANLLGSPMGISFEGLAGLQKNYFGTNGIEFTTNSAADIGIPGFNQYGQRVDLYQEDLLGSGLSGLINNHSMYKLTDYLALGAALSQLDSKLDTATLNALIKAGSNDMKASYEGVAATASLAATAKTYFAAFLSLPSGNFAKPIGSKAAPNSGASCAVSMRANGLKRMKNRCATKQRNSKQKHHLARIKSAQIATESIVSGGKA